MTVLLLSAVFSPLRVMSVLNLWYTALFFQRTTNEACCYEFHAIFIQVISRSSSCGKMNDNSHDMLFTRGCKEPLFDHISVKVTLSKCAVFMDHLCHVSKVQQGPSVWRISFLLNVSSFSGQSWAQLFAKGICWIWGFTWLDCSWWIT